MENPLRSSGRPETFSDTVSTIPPSAVIARKRVPKL
jgi:hypothetical protein